MNQTTPSRLSIGSIAFAAIVLLLLWAIFAYLLHSVILPSPVQVLQRFFVDMHTGLGHHLLISFCRMAAGLSLGIAIAVPLGLLLGREPRIDRYLAPFIYLIYPVPKVVFLPLLLILLGVGDLSKVLLIAIITFFQLVVTTRNTASGIDPKLIDSMRSIGCSRLQLQKHVVFPACLPEILNNLRIAIGSAIAVLFISETYATQVGIGYFIFDGMARFDYCSVFSGTIGISLMGLMLFFLLDVVQYCALPWKRC